MKSNLHMFIVTMLQTNRLNFKVVVLLYILSDNIKYRHTHALPRAPISNEPIVNYYLRPLGNRVVHKHALARYALALLPKTPSPYPPITNTQHALFNMHACMHARIGCTLHSPGEHVHECAKCTQSTHDTPSRPSARSIAQPTITITPAFRGHSSL